MNVNSGGALYEYNYAMIIKGNLAITGSAGDAYYRMNAFNTAYGHERGVGQLQLHRQLGTALHQRTVCTSQATSTTA